MKPICTRLAILAFFLLALAASGRPLKGQTFPGCTLPFESIKEIHAIDSSCGPQGETASDANRLQNIVKNNFCSTGDPVSVTFDTFLKLQQAAEDQHVPFGSSQRLPNDRSPLTNILTVTGGKQIGEGSVVRFVAFIVDAHYSNVRNGESVNCKLQGKENNDIHIMLGESSATPACSTVTAEMSPHFRPAAWDQIAGAKVRYPVRITGQLFFDASHKPCKNGTGPNPKRISIWEIHPVYKIDVCSSTTLAGCSADDESVWTPPDQVPWPAAKGKAQLKGRVKKPTDVPATSTPIQGRLPSIGQQEQAQKEVKKASLAVPSTIRLFVTRKYPWSTGSATASFSVTETSGQADVSPLTISIDPLTDKTDGRIMRAKVEGTLGDKSFNAADLSVGREKVVPIQVSIVDAHEAGLGESRLVFRSPSLSGEETVKLEAVIRDGWFCALLAVFLGTLFSYLALNWESVRRPLLLLKIESERIEEAARLLQRHHPDQSQALEAVYRALREARHFIDLLDQAKAKEQIQAAQDELDKITAAVEARAAAPPREISLLSSLTFRLFQNPVQNLRSLVSAPTEDLMIRRVRMYDWAVVLLAVAIVTWLGLEAVYQNQPFGGWDYGKAFLWGFGIDQTVKGFGPVLNKLRNG